MASSKSIRFKVSVLLAIPLTSLVAVWGFAAAVTVGDSMSLRSIGTLYESIGKPTADLKNAVQREHILSAEYLATRFDSDHKTLTGQRAVTDQVRNRLRQEMDGDAVQSEMSDEMRTRYAELTRQVEGLDAIRARIDSGRIGPVGLVEEFARVPDALNRLYNTLSPGNEIPIYRQLRGAVAVDQAMNMLSRERALATGPLALESPMTAGEMRMFTRLAGSRTFLMEQALPELEPSLRAPFTELIASSPYARFTAVEYRLLRGHSVSAAEWRAAGDALDAAYQRSMAEVGPMLVARAKPATTGVYVRADLVGVLGLVAVVASLLVSYRIGSGVTRELAAVRRAAADLAEVRLPGMMEKLRRGEKVDVTTEAPALEPLGSTAEIHDVAAAFDSVRRSAVDAAVEQARLREGTAQSFRNLARRSQSLLQRQLKLLDGMQKRAESPEALENLFRLDHLTTRMRRHAEGLVILSGGAAGRTWRSPVPMEDVLRGAAAQVEDYARVRIYPMGGTTLVGNAVADMMHLFAEILENATVFSPPDSQVSVRGELVGRGFAVEIEDRGLGVTAERRAAINERLASPPEFDPADTDRLGFAVIGLLAARYGAEVVLHSSPYGGTAVVVLIPEEPLGEPEPVEQFPEPPVLTVISVRPEPEGRSERAAGSGEPVEPAVPIPVDLWRPLRRVGGLPRRVRQANTPPRQVRESRPPDAEIEERSPEEARALMSAMQSGWRRGRAADEDGDAER
ncbi:ATP-binding protein [Streptosporangium sp. NBC_01755]|uniref:sensor histidine kinase n=1 Tax=unclassified Streptosporangium TaxID=2632669 RepID=UPI002DDA75D6|nr:MULTISPECIES: ATP-binding protein [unclassified Streptosporangium]WSA25019.1 ATP-binding protein [Streptosporangium sp. NBC_01810]WSD03650.1 ATP-binding protein [Streptosporangium sp. NBC_01755]